jgi:hypothetical protein
MTQTKNDKTDQLRRALEDMLIEADDAEFEGLEVGAQNVQSIASRVLRNHGFASDGSRIENPWPRSRTLRSLPAAAGSVRQAMVRLRASFSTKPVEDCDPTIDKEEPEASDE